jgi:hypothetical protein
MEEDLRSGGDAILINKDPHRYEDHHVLVNEDLRCDGEGPTILLRNLGEWPFNCYGSFMLLLLCLHCGRLHFHLLNLIPACQHLCY